VQGEINSEVGRPGKLSQLTIAGLEDLGYKVDYSTKEEYTAADLGKNCTCTSGVRARNVRSLQRGAHQLSNEKYESALHAGRRILETYKGLQPIDVSGLDVVAGQYVSLLVQEGDDIYAVDVYKGD
jgi:hypothetical protein